jgi:MFS family permease
MVAFGGILLLSAGLAAMSTIDRLWQLYLFFGLGRMIAVGPLSLVIPVTISNWFIRKRGRAMGIVWLGPRVGAAVLPALTQFFIVTQGWRLAWLALGTTVFLLSGIPSLLFLRRRPEDLNLQPDGDAAPQGSNIETVSAASGNSGQSAVDTEPSLSRAQALRTKAFWELTAMESIFFFVQAGTNFHIYPYLTDQGMGSTSAVFVLSTIAIFGSFGSIALGSLAERIAPKILLIINGIVSGLIFFLLYGVVEIKFGKTIGISLVFVLAACHGLLHGGRFPVLSVIWAEYFGRKSLGSIYGITSIFRYTANAMGPIFGAVCFDIFNSYAVPFYLFSCLFLVNGIIGMYLRPPRAFIAQA